VKQTKSEQVSDSVFFKTKYLTQPTLTPADVITKALNDLTQALKGKNNQQGIDQMEALTKLNYFHPKRKMPHDGCQRLLFEHANETTKIF
jgi:hypothetical protein